MVADTWLNACGICPSGTLLQRLALNLAWRLSFPTCLSLQLITATCTTAVWRGGADCAVMLRATFSCVSKLPVRHQTRSAMTGNKRLVIVQPRERHLFT